MLFFFIVFAALRGVPVYEEFVEGAKEHCLQLDDILGMHAFARLSEEAQDAILSQLCGAEACAARLVEVELHLRGRVK